MKKIFLLAVFLLLILPNVYKAKAASVVTEPDLIVSLDTATPLDGVSYEPDTGGATFMRATISAIGRDITISKIETCTAVKIKKDIAWIDVYDINTDSPDARVGHITKFSGRDSKNKCYKAAIKIKPAIFIPAGDTHTLDFSTGIAAGATSPQTVQMALTRISGKKKFTVSGLPLWSKNIGIAKVAPRNQAVGADVVVRPVNTEGKVYDRGQKNVVLAQYDFFAVPGVKADFGIGGFWAFMADKNGYYPSTLSKPAHFSNFSLWINGVKRSESLGLSSDGVIHFSDADIFEVSDKKSARIELRADVLPNISGARYRFSLSDYGHNGPLLKINSLGSVALGWDSEVRIKD